MESASNAENHQMYPKNGSQSVAAVIFAHCILAHCLRSRKRPNGCWRLDRPDNLVRLLDHYDNVDISDSPMDFEKSCRLLHLRIPDQGWYLLLQRRIREHSLADRMLWHPVSDWRPVPKCTWTHTSLCIGTERISHNPTGVCRSHRLNSRNIAIIRHREEVVEVTSELGVRLLRYRRRFWAESPRSIEETRRKRNSKSLCTS